MTYTPSNSRVNRTTATGLPLHDTVMERWDSTLAEVAVDTSLRNEDRFYHNATFLPNFDEVYEYASLARQSKVASEDEAYGFTGSSIWDLNTVRISDDKNPVTPEESFNLLLGRLPLAMEYKFSSVSEIYQGESLGLLTVRIERGQKAMLPITMFDLGVFWEELRSRPDKHVLSSNLTVGQIATLFTDSDRGVPVSTLLGYSNGPIESTLLDLRELGDDSLTWAVYASATWSSPVDYVLTTAAFCTLQNVLSFWDRNIGFHSIEGYIDVNLSLGDAIPYLDNGVQNLRFIKECIDSGIDPALASATGIGKAISDD